MKRDGAVKIDFRAIALAAWLPILFWLLAVLGATLSGYPGVICVTPMGWLLALPAGTRCLSYTTSQTYTARMIEAGIAGASVGVAGGILFALALAFASPLGLPGESRLEASATALIAFLLVGGVGAAVCAALAVGIAALQLRRTG